MSSGYSSFNQIHNTNKQVDEVIEIMRDNVNKVLERDEKLDNLENNSETLQSNSHRFVRSSTKLRRKMFWKNIKFTITFIVIIAIIIIIITLIAVKAR